MRKYDLIGVVLSLILAIFLAQFLTNGVSAVGPFAYSSKPVVMVKPDVFLHNLGQYVSFILWNLFGLDIIGQAVVLFSSAVGVIALLRERERD